MEGQYKHLASPNNTINHNNKSKNSSLENVFDDDVDVVLLLYEFVNVVRFVCRLY